MHIFGKKEGVKLTQALGSAKGYARFEVRDRTELNVPVALR